MDTSRAYTLPPQSWRIIAPRYDGYSPPEPTVCRKGLGLETPNDVPRSVDSSGRAALSQAGTDMLDAEIPATRKNHPADGPAVLVRGERLDGDHLAEHQVPGGRRGPVAEWLVTFWAVDIRHPDLVLRPVGHRGDRIAVGDGHETAGEDRSGGLGFWALLRRRWPGGAAQQSRGLVSWWQPTFLRKSELKRPSTCSCKPLPLRYLPFEGGLRDKTAGRVGNECLRGRWPRTSRTE